MDPVSASVDVSLIRERFNFGWAMSDPVEGMDTYWWWARSIRVDPSEVIADDDQGNLWSIPFSTDGEDEVTFGEPVRVRETFVPVGSGDGVAATAVVTRRRQVIAAAALQRPSKPTDFTHPQSASTAPSQEETPMDLTALREAYGLDDDMSDDDVIAHAAAQVADLDPEDVDTDESTPTEPEPTDTVTPPETVTVSTTQWQEMQEQLASLSVRDESRTKAEQKAHRDQVIASAVQTGRISPAERVLWRDKLDESPEPVEQLLTSLAARVPLAEIGHAGDADTADSRYAQLTADAPTYGKS